MVLYVCIAKTKGLICCRDPTVQKLWINYNTIYFEEDMYRLSEPRCEKSGFFAYAKTKTQISFAVTAKLISVFVFATGIEQS